MRVVLSLLLLLLPVCPAVSAPLDPPAPEPGLATISGVVFAQDGSPLPGVTLNLARPDGSESRLAATGEGGVFRLTGVASGTWDLAAASPGFAPTRADLADLIPGESRQVTLTLRVASIRETVEVVGAAPRDYLEASAIRESGAKDVGEALSTTVGVWKISRRH
jgi:hypothetical protein